MIFPSLPLPLMSRIHTLFRRSPQLTCQTLHVSPKLYFFADVVPLTHFPSVIFPKVWFSPRSRGSNRSLCTPQSPCLLAARSPQPSLGVTPLPSASPHSHSPTQSSTLPLSLPLPLLPSGHTQFPHTSLSPLFSPPLFPLWSFTSSLTEFPCQISFFFHFSPNFSFVDFAFLCISCFFLLLFLFFFVCNCCKISTHTRFVSFIFSFFFILPNFTFVNFAFLCISLSFFFANIDSLFHPFRSLVICRSVFLTYIRFVEIWQKYTNKTE